MADPSPTPVASTKKFGIPRGVACVRLSSSLHYKYRPMIRMKTTNHNACARPHPHNCYHSVSDGTVAGVDGTQVLLVAVDDGDGGPVTLFPGEARATPHQAQSRGIRCGTGQDAGGRIQAQHRQWPPGSVRTRWARSQWR